MSRTLSTQTTQLLGLTGSEITRVEEQLTRLESAAQGLSLKERWALGQQLSKPYWAAEFTKRTGKTYP